MGLKSLLFTRLCDIVSNLPTSVASVTNDWISLVHEACADRQVCVGPRRAAGDETCCVPSGNRNRQAQGGAASAIPRDAGRVAEIGPRLTWPGLAGFLEEGTLKNE